MSSGQVCRGIRLLTTILVQSSNFTRKGILKNNNTISVKREKKNQRICVKLTCNEIWFAEKAIKTGEKKNIEPVSEK